MKSFATLLSVISLVNGQSASESQDEGMLLRHRFSECKLVLNPARSSAEDVAIGIVTMGHRENFPMWMRADVKGLTPIANTKYSFAVHARAWDEQDCASAGPVMSKVG